jgi:hypothetical protein
MSELKMGDRVRILNGGECKVLAKLGEGGQGIVYKVSYEGKEMALKWYFIEKMKNPKQFYSNLQRNIEQGAPTDSFLWPQELSEYSQGESFGYLMELRPQQYEDFSRFLLARVRFSSVSALINAGLNMVEGFRALHNRGYSYQDLNDGNFFINPQSGDVLICDNDNVAPYGENLGIAGKSGFMAPEIVLKKKNPDVNTDKFSLAVMLYLLLFMNRPLEGKRTMVPCMTEELEHKFYGSEPVFMYDPTDDSNRPVKGVHTNAIRRWPIYPEYIREAFVKAFSKNSMNGTTPRIIEKEWQELLTRMRDDLAICEHCGNETFVHYDREMICINCGKPVKVSYSLKTSRYNVPLLKGKYLYKCHTDASSEDFKTITVEIKTKKTDPSVIGLKNVSGLNWIVNNADGTILNVKNGDMLTVQKGMEIMMGSTKTIVQ